MNQREMQKALRKAHQITLCERGKEPVLCSYGMASEMVRNGAMVVVGFGPDDEVKVDFNDAAFGRFC